MSFMTVGSTFVDGPNGPFWPHVGRVGATTRNAQRNRTVIVAAICSPQTVTSGGKTR